jgi:hypothetical protein
MSKNTMPCHISDGPETPEDVDRGGFNDRYSDPDEARDYQAGVADAHARTIPMLHTKISTLTGKTLYSYDKAYWWSTEESAWRVFQKLEESEQ